MAKKRNNPSRRHAGPTRGRHVALEGRLHITNQKFATVSTPEGCFVVARGGLRGAMSGDLVQVEKVRRGGTEPKVVVRGVVERAVESFVGTFHVGGPLGIVSPLDERIPRDFYVLPNDKSVRSKGVADGDLVVARILGYPSRHEEGVVTLTRRIGPSDGLDLPIERIVATHGLETRFSIRARDNASKIVADVEGALASQPERKDLRALLCVTVDPADARDFDDAVSCVRTADGGFELGVHIADVTQYVAWGDPCDLEARRRTCSAYLVDRVLPMLPERLSNDICSLRPGEDRLTMSVLMRLDAEGRVLESRACASAIRSRARLCYGDVDELLAGQAGAGSLACEEGVSRDEVAAMLHGLSELAQLRRKIRRERGSIDFEGAETKVTLDECGKPTGVTVRRTTPATSLIEEAMLLANEAVAGMLAEREGFPCAFRVHEPPSPEHLLSALPPICELGLVERGEADRICSGDPFAMQAVLARAKDTSAEFIVTTLLLRAQKRAIYLPRNDGHYALGATAYCHFTSPIRRYPDVTVHRALKRLLGVPVPCADDEAADAWGKAATAKGEGKKGDGAAAAGEPAAPAEVRAMDAGDAGVGASVESKYVGRAPIFVRAMRRADWLEAERCMPQLCRTCSDKEREADAAARESQQVKMAELFASHVGEAYSGVVTGCKDFGLFVRLDDSCAEGLVPVRELGDEWFTCDEAGLNLTGEESGKRWRLGQRIAVRVTGCTPARGRIDFGLAGKENGR